MSLGLGRAGITTIAFSENDTWCSTILQRHWPGVPNLGDITQLGIQPTSSAEDSLVRTSVSQVREPPLPESVPDSGGTCAEPFAWFDPSTCLWRTWQPCASEGWVRFSETWPRAGMIRNGIADRRVRLVPLTGATGFGLLPTPTTSDAKGSGKKRYFGSPYYKGNLREFLRTSSEDPIYPHPNFLEWMMQYPSGWTESGGSATPSSRKSPN